MTTTAEINVGDFWYDSWGYDQTNVGFYQVIAKTACMVTLQEVETEYEAETWGSGKKVPTNKPREGKEPFKKRVSICYGRATFGSPWHGSCFPYEGAPVYTSDWA